MRRATPIARPPAATAAERLAGLRARIARACRDAGRDPAEVAIVAVAKTRPAAAVEELIRLGVDMFGENRVQEAAAKWPALRAAHPGVALHLVGQLQSNKAAEAVALFDAIHSLDRPSLVEALARACDRAGHAPLLFCQVNIGAEPQKGGCAIEETPTLLKRASDAGLRVEGLMCVPPAGLEAAPFFALMAKMADQLGLPLRSMGMSDDLEAAVMLGATHVRPGSALFGERPAPGGGQGEAPPLPAAGG
ncbi:MAG: YggS family pyridoxal phosphate-dependent enzyme [Sphingomonadaceae bacterium]